MTSKPASDERREHKRFLVKECMISINSKRGIIVDISRGGLSFYYADNRKWSEYETEAKILFVDDDLCLNNIPVITISDHLIDGNFSPDTQQLRRRSLEFGELTKEKLLLLDDAIRSSTTAKV